MELLDFKNRINSLLKDIDLSIDDNMVSDLYRYMNLVLEWNKNINLTAIVDEEDFILKHFVDSLTIDKYVKGKSIVDVGTGAGFPGIPLAIYNRDNNTSVFLVDSLNKRINFLNEVIKEINLENVYTVHSRAEEFGCIKREAFDVAVSRAVARLNVLVEYLLPLVKVGGHCICMKGEYSEEEINEAKNAIDILGGKISKVEKIKLPNSDIDRTIIVIEKIKNTPKKYPRKPGTASKSPIV